MQGARGAKRPHGQDERAESHWGSPCKRTHIKMNQITVLLYKRVRGFWIHV